MKIWQIVCEDGDALVLQERIKKIHIFPPEKEYVEISIINKKEELLNNAKTLKELADIQKIIIERLF